MFVVWHYVNKMNKNALQIQDKGPKTVPAQLNNWLRQSQLKTNVKMNENCLFVELHFDSLTRHQIVFLQRWAFNQKHTFPLSLGMQWPMFVCEARARIYDDAKTHKKVYICILLINIIIISRAILDNNDFSHYIVAIITST